MTKKFDARTFADQLWVTSSTLANHVQNSPWLVYYLYPFRWCSLFQTTIMSNVELHASLLKHGEDEDDVSITATDLEKNSHELSRYQTTTKTTPYLWIILPWCLLLVLSMWLLFQQYYREPVQVSVSRLLYSKLIAVYLHFLPKIDSLGPAQDALGYEIKKFRLGLHDDITEYQGDPTPELDERWESLYKSKSSLNIYHNSTSNPILSGN